MSKDYVALFFVDLNLDFCFNGILSCVSALPLNDMTSGLCRKPLSLISVGINMLCSSFMSSLVSEEVSGRYMHFHLLGDKC